MSVIKWRDSYATNVKEFDQDHRKIIQLINDLLETLQGRKDTTACSRVLDELYSYTLYHFSSEEKKMAQYSYPGLADHHNEHEKLKKQVVQYRNSDSLDDHAAIAQIYQFMREWFLHHIMETDKKYGEFFSKTSLG